ncbi:MAG: hypothetical protein ABIJ56_00510 [Pseudomonadota bacterium]
MPDKPTIFVDRSLGAHIVANALRAAGMRVITHDNLFDQDASDEEWLLEVGRKNWIAISKDYARAQSTLQRLTVARTGACLFVLRTTASLKGPELAKVFVNVAPKMQRLAASIPAPFIAKIYASGEVHLWKDRKTLLSELAKSG